MNAKVIKIGERESVSVAARTMTHYNIGALPVCGSGGLLKGMITDRDIVIRCLASNKDPNSTTVGQIMTPNVVSVQPDADVAAAALMMGKRQVRRLPVVSGEKLCGMIALSDLACNEDVSYDAADALANISTNILGD